MEKESPKDTLSAPKGKVQKHMLEDAQKTFFFERHDGSIISVHEQEAWDILNGRTPIVGFRHYRPKLVGVSDGQVFRQAVVEAWDLHDQGKEEEALARLARGKEEEQAAAMGKVEMPRNYDTTDRWGRPVRISDLR